MTSFWIRGSLWHHEWRSHGTETLRYEKYFLDIKEAAEYYGIGLKKVRRLAEDGMGRYAILCGNRYLIVRTKFEEFIKTTMLSGTPGNLGAEVDKDSDL